MQLDFMAGTHIASAAAQLVEAAKANGSASGKFNDIDLTASADTTPEEIVDHYDRELSAKAEAYRNSKEGKADARRDERERAELQAKHDALMVKLSSLEWSNDAAVLDWLCALQECSDRRGVLVKNNTIVLEFEKHGFKANENVGPAYRDGDRNNMFRYLVGQALSGLKHGPSIHPILHSFADKWRERFGVRSETAS